MFLIPLFAHYLFPMGKTRENHWGKWFPFRSRSIFTKSGNHSRMDPSQDTTWHSSCDGKCLSCQHMSRLLQVAISSRHSFFCVTGEFSLRKDRAKHNASRSVTSFSLVCVTPSDGERGIWKTLLRIFLTESRESRFAGLVTHIWEAREKSVINAEDRGILSMSNVSDRMMMKWLRFKVLNCIQLRPNFKWISTAPWRQCVTQVDMISWVTL